MEWVLLICTQGWIMCGSTQEIPYPSEAACYRARKALYEQANADDFKYVICKPAHQKGATNGQE